MDEVLMRLSTSERAIQLVTKAVVLCAYGLYGFMLCWAVSIRQGPAYDGPHRLPTLSPATTLALCAALAVPMLFVRRRTILVFGVILAESVLASEFGARAWVVSLASIAIVVYLAVRRPTVAAVAGLATVAVSIVENTVIYPVDKSVNLGQQIAQLALWLAIAWLIGYALRKRREYVAALREQSAARALMAERLRIARNCTTAWRTASASSPSWPAPLPASSTPSRCRPGRRSAASRPQAARRSPACSACSVRCDAPSPTTPHRRRLGWSPPAGSPTSNSSLHGPLTPMSASS
ncbi:MAG TPA: hypothetical protein VFU65_12685 [Actinocrinis sp.]|nr:hypothetical protein [Actinocrinis sp.]